VSHLSRRLAAAWAAVTRRTPAFSSAYRPAPAPLAGQLWAGLTRNTPAFTGALPPRASADPADTDYVPEPQAGVQSVSRSGVQVGRTVEEQAAPAEGAVLGDEELDALLRAIQGVGPSPAQLTINAESSRAAMELLVTPERSGLFTVTMRIVPGAEHIVPDGMSFALVLDGRYFLALMAADGSVAFQDVPPGEWNIRRLRRRPGLRWDGQSVALPLSRPPAHLAAAERGGDTAILRVLLPGAQTELVLHREETAEFLLEVILRSPNETPLVVTVRYGTTDGKEQLLLIPVLRTGLARLVRYDPASPWQSSRPTPPDQIRAWEAGAVAVSVGAAANNITRRAWREISAVTPGIRLVIDAELGKR
jgi:hypothetical protein